MALDKLDRELLNVLQEDAGLTADQLAERFPLSSSAIQRRIRRLRDTRVIQRDIAVIDPKRVGRPTTFIVSVIVERETTDRLAAFRRWLNNEPHVQQVFYVTGDTDYLLVVVAPDAEAYDTLMARMVEDNPSVKRFTSQVVMNVIKRGLAIPVPEDNDAIEN